ncbi:type 4 pilus major pilin [Yersinia mollaretii]|uniref:type 4 pilus major pilin n=1 Tax=Yersinia mollaretii TaxID=33060 RepID=UPI0005E99EE9|nr:type 4 pilus major pilin [Yersinia mollaretii]MDN0111366.1 type 4 pilus major pilin [Yersinia mollaretii]PJE88276.1 pilus assembly protein [Yersinia mollaretii]CQD41621.1 putative type IV prepilin [Yersinia mollaretii]CQH06865.1 putative type IV prepilin [Yersinia mollaretii]
MKLINGLKKNNVKKSQQGLTLIEASMVLALSAVVIAGAVMYYNSASESNKIQRAQGLLGSIQSAVQSNYATRTNYTGLAVNEITFSAAIPRSFLYGTGTGAKIINPWGGDVLLTAGTPNTTYTVTYQGIPPSACVSMANVDLGNSMVGLSIGGTALTIEGLTGARVGEACNSATNREIDVMWTFK